MREKLTVQDIHNIFGEISNVMNENKGYLCQLDGALGDGDIGLTMSKGFTAIINNLEQIPEQDIGIVFMRSAVIMGEAVASTMGTLMATALINAGKVSQGKSELLIEDLIVAVRAMIDGIMKRGKAQVGDKTIIDALFPAAEAMETAHKEGKSLVEVLKAAYEAAEAGKEKTKGMQSRHGRAQRYLEKSIGLQDPGATVGALFFKGFYNYVIA